MDNGATRILFNKIISDEMYDSEVQALLKTTSTLEGKALAVRYYCDRNLCRGLGGRVEMQLIKNIMNKTSWLDLASELDGRTTELPSTFEQ